METQSVKVKTRHLDIRPTWNLLNREGKNQGTLEVGLGENIEWLATKSPMLFILPKKIKDIPFNIDDHFEYAEGTFKNGKTQKIEVGEMLTLIVKEEISGDLSHDGKIEIEYDIVILGTGEFVTGNSRPKLIIRL